MHIVEIHGGLGNQMFQYAFALALDKVFGDVELDLYRLHTTDTAHNGYELDRLFEVTLPTCSEADRRRLGDMSSSLIARGRRKFHLYRPSYYVELDPNYSPRPFHLRRDMYFTGYWQSQRYFEGIETAIRKVFSFRPSLTQADTRLLDSFSGRTAIAIHVRRGDSLQNPVVNNVCSVDYYRRAIASASEGAGNPAYVFFSDDLAWCRDKLAVGIGDCFFVDWNRGADSFADMRLMSLCDRFVMSNSSFSWWGAWLGRPGRVIIAPSRWYSPGCTDSTSIVLPSWRRISI